MQMEDEDFDADYPVCLKHSHNWRNRFQNLLNLLRDNPIKKEIVDKFGKVICTCDPAERVADGSLMSVSDIDQTRWQQVTEQQYTEAVNYFEQFIERQDKCSELHSHLQFHYKHMRDTNLLREGDTSAKRFLYLFYVIDRNADYSFLYPIRAVSKPEEEKFKFEVPLTKLKQEYVGLYIGRRGRKLKGILKSFKNVKVSVDRNSQPMKAVVSCKQEDKNDIMQKLIEAEDFLITRREAHELRVRQYEEENENSMDTF